MKLSRIKYIIAACGMLMLVACSRGSGTPYSTISVTSTDASGVQKTFTATPSNAIMKGTANTVENKTVIQMCGDVDKDNDCSQLMILTIDGTTPGQYTITSIDSVSQIMYHDDEQQEVGIVNHYISNSGVINLSSIGAVGQPVAGDYSAVLECSVGCTGTVNVNGTFSVVLSE